ncbi:hypothetical protein Bbelb_203390 [Branchiostoma belcheri]|nr:hypothetical protein Bbelb_203390 [Branchiostoma belcheri]
MAAKKPTFKLVLLGEVGVGKTSLFLRLKDGIFLEDSHASIGVDCCETAVSVEGEEVRIRSPPRTIADKAGTQATSKTLLLVTLCSWLCVWDTAGVERFRTLTQGYYRHADAVLLVYSLPDSATLRMLTSWVREVNDRTVMSNTPVLKIIVGNKSDLEHRTSEQAAAELAAAFGCELVLQVSARTGENTWGSYRCPLEQVRTPGGTTGEGMKEALQVIAGKLLARSRERKRSHLTSPASDDVSPLTETTDVTLLLTTEKRQRHDRRQDAAGDREMTETRQRDDRETTETRQTSRCCWRQRNDRDTTERRQRDDRETTDVTGHGT